jgi:hypothetical protein
MFSCGCVLPPDASLVPSPHHACSDCPARRELECERDRGRAANLETGAQGVEQGERGSERVRERRRGEEKESGRESGERVAVRGGDSEVEPEASNVATSTTLAPYQAHGPVRLPSLHPVIA